MLETNEGYVLGFTGEKSELYNFYWGGSHPRNLATILVSKEHVSDPNDGREFIPDEVNLLFTSCVYLKVRLERADFKSDASLQFFLKMEIFVYAGPLETILKIFPSIKISIES